MAATKKAQKSTSDPKKNPKGGLTEAGRKHFKKTEGSDLKPGVQGKADTPEKQKRKGALRDSGGRFRFCPTEAIQHAEAKMLEVIHPKGPPQDGPEAVVQTLGATVATPVAEVVRDLV